MVQSPFIVIDIERLSLFFQSLVCANFAIYSPARLPRIGALIHPGRSKPDLAAAAAGTYIMLTLAARHDEKSNTGKLGACELTKNNNNSIKTTTSPSEGQPADTPEEPALSGPN